MAYSLVPDLLWEEIEPLLPPEPSKPDGGRPRADNRACLTGIMFVLRTGCPWGMIPRELIGGIDPTTCWRRFRDWTRARVWRKLHRRLLNRLRKQGILDLEYAAIDSASVRAVLGGITRAQTPRIAGNRAVSGI